MKMEDKNGKPGIYLLMNLYHVKRLIVIFYAIGILGLLLPWSATFFIAITPLALLFSAYLLAIYHYKYAKNDVWAFILIFVLGFSIEAIGVNTGYIFGCYSYGSALGFKVFNTPLLIGLNWLVLAYTSGSISEKMTKNAALQIVMAPSIMLVYDLMLEQTAPKMDMWHWTSASVPLKNYIAWWIIGLVFTCIFKLFKVNVKNPLAFVLLICQFLFFMVLFFAYNLFQ